MKTPLFIVAHIGTMVTAGFCCGAEGAASDHANLRPGMPGYQASTAILPDPTQALTADDITNLCVCARRALPSLTTEEIAAVALALKHAEAKVAEMRKLTPIDTESHVGANADYAK